VEQPDETNKFVTRHLNPDNMPPAVRRGTGPLDYLVPWVVELRVVGTTSVIQIEVAESLIIGRSDKDKRVLPQVDLSEFNAYYMGVSRQHAVISARNSRITIHDLNSANGTFINGGRLEPQLEYRLRHGDQLTLGKLQLQVFFVVTPSSYEKNETAFADVSISIIGSGERILIVDDDVKVAQAIGSVLQEAGFVVQVAKSVSDAITVVDNRLPDIILTELILPDISGLELVRYIYDRAGARHLPIVVITGATGGYQMGQAIEAGIDIFLTKPVGVDELMRSLAKIVQQMKA